MTFVPTRKAARDQLELFAPKAGQFYAENRNFDREQGHTSSRLSPYLRHRLITEQEVCEHILTGKQENETEKFIQEVFWRSYFKGWLELRPSIFADYCAQRDGALVTLEKNEDLKKRVAAATAGETGIDGFDQWARELVETGYLHNHARMWFASIWIFTLSLPWTLGADFFYRHLIDGDPASNTLSWRWVAGLHTRGKCYAAKRTNIETFTDGRFSPAGLNENPQPLAGPQHPDPIPLPQMQQALPTAPTFVLLTDDHCSFTPYQVENEAICGAAVLNTIAARSPLGVGSLAGQFHAGALEDAAHRFQESHGVHPIRTNAACLANIIQDSGAQQLIVSWPTVGTTRAVIAPVLRHLERVGVSVIRQYEPWDQRAWPHATKGFFSFRKKIPSLLTAANIAE